MAVSRPPPPPAATPPAGGGGAAAPGAPATPPSASSPSGRASSARAPSSKAECVATISSREARRPSRPSRPLWRASASPPPRAAALALRRRVLVARARRLGPARGEGLAQRSHAGDEFLRLPLALAAAGFRLHDLLAAIPRPPRRRAPRQRRRVGAAARLPGPRLEVVEPVTAGLELRLLGLEGGRDRA